MYRIVLDTQLLNSVTQVRMIQFTLQPTDYDFKYFYSARTFCAWRNKRTKNYIFIGVLRNK